jgi:hypothetical protein
MNIPTQGRPLALAKEELLRMQDHQDLQELNAIEREAGFEDALEAAKGSLPAEIFAVFVQMAKMINRPAAHSLPSPEEFERQAKQQAVYQYAPMYAIRDGFKETLIDFQALVLDARSIEFDHKDGEARLWFSTDTEPLVFRGGAAIYLRKYLAHLGIFMAIGAREQCPECRGVGVGCVRCGEIGWVLDEAKIAPQSSEP